MFEDHKIGIQIASKLGLKYLGWGEIIDKGFFTFNDPQSDNTTLISTSEEETKEKLIDIRKRYKK